MVAPGEARPVADSRRPWRGRAGRLLERLEVEQRGGPLAAGDRTRRTQRRSPGDQGRRISRIAERARTALPDRRQEGRRRSRGEGPPDAGAREREGQGPRTGRRTGCEEERKGSRRKGQEARRRREEDQDDQETLDEQ